MGYRTTSKRRRGPRTILPVVAALMMLLATAPGLSAQEAPGGFPAGTVPEVVPGTCAHAPGEFLVGYTSEEAFQAAPTENVVGTFPEILAQHLAFPEVAGDPAAEEAKRQELSAQPGVAYAEYNCTAQVNQTAATPEATPEAAPESASALPPAICANCGRYVVEKAGKILDGESGGKDAYDAALDAARTSSDDDIALASETESGEEDVGSDSAGGDSDTEAGSEGSSGSEEEPADAAEGSASSNTEAEPGEEEADVDTEPVSQRNVLANGLRETASSPPVMILGAGVLLLAAGLFVARRTFGK